MGYDAVTLDRLAPETRERIAASCFEAAAEGHPLYGRLTHRYYEAYFGPAQEPHDAVVLRDGVPVLFMPLSGGEGKLSYFGEPARTFAVPAATEPEAEAFAALRALLGAAAARFPSLWMVENARFGGTVQKREQGEIAVTDLAATEAEIRSHLRKSYKSLVNWGLRNLELSLIDRDNPDYAAFCEMREFHRAVAGRATRSDQTWELQFEMIRAGESYAVLGRLAGRLVAASLVSHGSRAAYYGVGIYDRALMADGKPVGHASVFRAILHARSLGLREFMLGEVTATGEQKADNIALFKKGFATRVLAESRVEIGLP